MNETLKLDAFPGQSVSLLLFKDVTNSADLRNALLAKSLDPEVALINASVILDVFLFHLAAYKTLNDQNRGKLTTQTLHSELVFNLAGSKHIRDSLANFGISTTTGSLLVARFNASDEELAQIRSMVKGTEMPVADLCQVVDMVAAKKAFRCTDQDLEVGSLLEHALCKMAIRDC